MMRVTFSRMSTYCMNVVTDGHASSFDSACEQVTADSVHVQGIACHCSASRGTAA